jgi:pyruvate dehydrogenase E2 component (dihydrolipoamide acetyltransferase)
MASLLRMPSVAAGVDEAVLASWTVPVHGSFSAGDGLAVVETDKAAVDLEAEHDGVLLAVLADAGATVSVGSPIALLGAPGEQPPTPAPEDPRAAMAHSQPSMAVNGPSLPLEPGRVFASPLARRLAREAGLAIEEITGSGPNGRVTGRDVRAVAAATSEAVARPDVAATPATEAARPVPARPGTTDIPHTRLRRAIADRLTQSVREAPHFYLRGSVRAEELLNLRAQINESSPVRVSVNDLIVKAVAHAHLSVPEMNVIWTPEAVRSFESVDVGVAVATDRGLLTPVVRDADTASITTIARQSGDLAERARRGELKQHELEGGTITVTNLGMFGVEEFAAIINPPQAAILAVGAVRPEPVADDDGAVVAVPLMRLTLSVDHRPVDGVVAARWMQALIELLEWPLGILL